MLNEKDVLIRMLTSFIQKLSELLTKKNISEVYDCEINVFYSEAFDMNRDLVLSLDIESLLDICKHNQVYCNEKGRILAELLYLETLRDKKSAFVKNYAKKAIQLFHYYTQYTKTYDLDVINKITQLSKIIENE